jgi:uncharacterized protein YbjQ (UPF0145 family)
MTCGVVVALVVVVLELVLGVPLDEPLPPHAAKHSAAASIGAIRETFSSMESDTQVIGLEAQALQLRAMPDQGAATTFPMTTALELSGWRIGETLGVCYGLVVRSMGFTGGVTASFRGLRRGEIPEYTQLLEDSRRHAIDRMVDNARLLGADAAVAVRFDSSEIGQQFTEIVAYGTAVKAERLA